MENDEFRLSINAKTIILILLLLNVGYACKKIMQYNHIKEVGYIRERSVQEQIRKRVNRSFGSVEEMDRLIVDFAKQKENADKLTATLKEQENQMSKVYRELEDAKLKNREEKDYLHNKIRNFADGFSKRKDQYTQMSKANEELKNAKLKIEKEKFRLQKKIRDLEDLLSKHKNQ